MPINSYYGHDTKNKKRNTAPKKTIHRFLSTLFKINNFSTFLFKIDRNITVYVWVGVFFLRISLSLSLYWFPYRIRILSPTTFNDFISDHSFKALNHFDDVINDDDNVYVTVNDILLENLKKKRIIHKNSAAIGPESSVAKWRR